MGEKVISFNKTGYDLFIDFIKAYAILCVLLGHTFPFRHETGYFLWYGMQVPMFILVQVFHVFKKEEYRFSFKKVFFRILLPFFITQAIAILTLLINGSDWESLVKKIVVEGGIGPGSYFPWLYLQMAILLFFIRPFFHKGSKLLHAIIALLVCEFFEILLSIIDCPDFIYRLLPIRYFFLIYLGWLWVKEGIVLNAKTIVLSLLSMGSIIYFEYYYSSIEPWFFDTAWKAHRWPCYFYVSTLLCGLLFFIFKQVQHNRYVVKGTQLLAKCSYEIFLLQMITIPLVKIWYPTQHSWIRYGIYLFLIWTISIVGGYYFNQVYSKFLKRTKA